jgi:molybdopterin adenylyltransferase
MSPAGTFEVVAINLSAAKGTVKRPVDVATVTDRGLEGDAHAGLWHRQVSLLGQADIDLFATDLGRPLAPGEFAENLSLGGIDLGAVAVLDRLYIGDVELEVTQIGKTCHGSNCAIFQATGDCVMPRKGLFARVIRGGTIRPGDPGRWIPRPLRAAVLTLSDRAHAGEYEDRSGPRVRELLEAHFGATRWHLESTVTVLPDDADRLATTLTQLRDDGVDLVFTTGGTGVGPRDITPDVVTDLADKLVPGIMDAIRLKYGTEKPNALLSRSVAAVLGGSLVYALPGSVRAVDEYMEEILRTTEHLIKMLHGLGH